MPRASDHPLRTGRHSCPALVRFVFLGAVGLLLTCPTATRAESVSAPDSASAPNSVSAPESASPPDSARIASLRFVLLNFDDVRVATGGTRLLGRSRDISSDGFRLREFGKGITSPAQEHLVPWAQIESIQVRRSASGVGPLAGAAIGFAIGFTIHVAQVPAAIFSFGETKPNGTPILVGVVGGAALGALLNRAGPWHTVYP